MKKKNLISLLLLMAVILFGQCRTCDCSYQPKKAKVTHPWVKR